MDRVEALAWAERARATRERVLDDLSTGARTLDDICRKASTDEFVGRIKVLTVVQRLPGWGKVASRRALDSMGIDSMTPVGEVDPAALLEMFGVLHTSGGPPE